MPKAAIISFLCLVSLWALGLFLSHIETKRMVEEFYIWAHNNPSIDCDSYTELVKETAPLLIERFEKSDGAFKKHMVIGNQALPLKKRPPWPYFITGLSSASNGSGCQTGISPVSTHYFAHIRTEAELGDTTYGVVMIAVESSLFGL